MIRFSLHERVRVDDSQSPLHGKTGTVVRLRHADTGAWVNMDDALPDERRSFPADDPHGRANHVLLYPEDCVPAPPTAPTITTEAT